MRKRLDSERFVAKLPGPVRMLRPELPNRYAPVGTTGNAERSNQRSGVGLSSEPSLIRFGRVASPRFTLELVVRGVKGDPVEACTEPASCHPRSNVKCG